MDNREMDQTKTRGPKPHESGKAVEKNISLPPAYWAIIESYGEKSPSKNLRKIIEKSLAS